MKILLINPNTTQHVTQRAVESARSIASPDTVIEGVTGHFGAEIISSLCDNAVGTYCAMELAAKHSKGFDAILLAVSFDTGLYELRELLSIPIAGMTESALRNSKKFGHKFSLISFNKKTYPMYRLLVERYKMDTSMASIRLLEPFSAKQLKDTEFLTDRISQVVKKAINKDGTDVAILSATAFSGLAAQIEENVGIPILDGVAEAVMDIQNSASELNQSISTLTSDSSPDRKQLKGVSKELESLYLNF